MYPETFSATVSPPFVFFITKHYGDLTTVSPLTGT